MSLYFINQILFPFFSICFLISILGYGFILNQYFRLDDNFFYLKNLIFIQGLILVSFFSIIINFFIPISNLITMLITIGGLIFYFFYFLKLKTKSKEIIFIISVIILSFILSFYAGVSDDFVYHFETIKNFKNHNIFEITHHRMISYNSNWLFLNAVFSIDYFYSTIFIISSLIYGILIYDTYHLYIHSFKNKNFYVGLVSFFILIFFLGVINKYKDFGTDIPGSIISFYILIIITYFIFDNKVKNVNKTLVLIYLLAIFSFVIKITNSLVFLYFFLIIYKINFRTLNYKYFLIISLLPIFWFFQNYNISGCLIWPIEVTCFSNNKLAMYELYLIESFAKGDIAASMNTNGFEWITVWLQNHSNKLIETYLIFTIIVIYPILFFFIKNIVARKSLLNLNKQHIKNFSYNFFIFIILLSNFIWFISAPAYRFGIFYNLCIIIFLALPFWIKLLLNNYNFMLKYCKFITFIIFMYFIMVNINKINWYNDRYDVWPPIQNNEVVSRKSS